MENSTRANVKGITPAGQPKEEITYHSRPLDASEGRTVASPRGKPPDEADNAEDRPPKAQENVEKLRQNIHRNF